MTIPASLRRGWRRFPVAMGLAPAAAVFWIWWNWAGYYMEEPGWPGWQLHTTATLLCALCFSVAAALLAEGRSESRSLIGQAAGAVCGAGLYLLSLLSYPASDWPPVLQLLLAALLLGGYALTRDRAQTAPLRQAFSRTAATAAAGVALCALLWLAGRAILYIVIVVCGVAEFPFRNYYTTWIDLNGTAAGISFGWAGVWLLLSLMSGSAASADQKEDRLAVSVLTGVLVPVFVLLTVSQTAAYAYLLLSGRFRADGWLNPYVFLTLTVYISLQFLLTGEENRAARFFVRYGAWLVLPLYASQIIGAFMRVSAYSLTANRVFCVVFLLACVIPLEAGIRRQRGRLVLPVLTAALIILTSTPLSAFHLAWRAQENRVFGLLTQAGMLDEDGRIVPGGHGLTFDEMNTIENGIAYLLNNSKEPVGSRTAALRAQVSKADGSYLGDRIENLLGFGTDTVLPTGRRTARLRGSWKSDKLDTTGYSRAELISCALTKDGGFTFTQNGVEITLDMVLPAADFENGVLSRDVIDLSGGRELRIIELDRTTENDSLLFYTLLGWLMTK